MSDTTLAVTIPHSALEAEAKKRIKSLESKLAYLDIKIDELEREIRVLQSEIRKAEGTVALIRNFVQNMKELHDLYGDDYE